MPKRYANSSATSPGAATSPSSAATPNWPGSAKPPPTSKTAVSPATPDLACFTTWGQVVDYVTHDHQGGELKLLVQLIDTFGAPRILDALANTVAEDNADVVISTAHKSKGREWNRVALAGDYPPPPPDRHDNTPEELRLLYVAVTRARHHLDTTRVPHATRHPNRQPATPGPPTRTAQPHIAAS